MTGLLSAAAARRIALAAQGFDRARPGGRIDVRHLRRVIAQLGVLQLDSVNVLSRSHYLPVYSRLGPYPRELLDGLAWGPRRELLEYWAHEASLVPLSTQPLLRWRMDRADADAWGMIRRAGQDAPQVAAILDAVARLGPVRAGDVSADLAARSPGDPAQSASAAHPIAAAPSGPKPTGLWNWDETKRVLEYLFWTGQITAARRVHFQRYYDLTERVLPASILQAPTPPVDEAQRQLLMIAAKAFGVATEPDLRDYFRLPAKESAQRVRELVDAGELIQTRVEGWSSPAYLHPDSARPRRITARAVLSPFDSLIWFRDRALRLFDFHFRLEIYTPAHKRVHGYYVLPFLLGDQIVARVDLAADRKEGLLRVHAAHAEVHVASSGRTEQVARELAAELSTLAGWLGLERIAVGGGGDLAAPLTAAVAAS
jgi:uncharacterized protein YcaQ